MKKFFWPVAIAAVLLALWAFLYYVGAVSKLFLPSPLEVAETIWLQLFVTHAWWTDVFATFSRMAIGFTVGGFIGVVAGLALGLSKRAYSALEFFIDFFRSIPATALFPLFLLFFGIGDEAKIAVAIWVSALLVLVNASYGVRHASKLRLMAARVFRPSKVKLFKDVVLFEAAPHVASGLRIALSFSLAVVVVTEMFIGTSVGLGRRIMDAQLVYQTPEMYAAIILAGVLGYLANQAFLVAEKRLLHCSGC